MSTKSILKCAPDRAFHVRELSAISGVEIDRLRRLLRKNLIPASATGKKRGKWLVYAHAIPWVGYCGKNSTKGLDSDLHEYSNYFLTHFKKHWNKDFSKKWWMRMSKEDLIKWDDLNSSNHSNRVEQVSEMVESFKESLEGLRNLLRAENKVVRDRAIRCGFPTIVGTRIGVYEAAGLAKVDGMEIARECYPTLSEEDIEDAMIYAKAYHMAHPTLGRKVKIKYPKGVKVTTYVVELPKK